MFRAALFMIAKTWKQSKCPSTDEWLKEMWYIHNYSVGFSMEWLLPCELYPFKFLPTLSSLGLTTIAAAAAKSLKSCPTLRDPTDGSPPGFPVPGILQARILEWVAISFSNA